MWFPPINLWTIPKQKRDYMKFTIETSDIKEISAIISALNGTAPVALKDDCDGPDVVEQEVKPAASPKGRKSKVASTPAEGGANNIRSEAGSPVIIDAPASEPAVDDEADEEIEPIPASVSSPDVKLTIDDVRKALSELNSDRGLVVAKQALDKFGCARVSDLIEGRYAEFIAHCDSLRG